MKTIITAAAVLLAANVSAADFYQGLEQGNSDLYTPRTSVSEPVGAQPSIGDSVDRYRGFGDGNPDLFKRVGSQERASTGQPDIYMNVSGNPDLSF